jgi:predicted pyridoxine 5'-phosphate oxidase superfamily flavin-nucleotide-binding protein
MFNKGEEAIQHMAGEQETAQLVSRIIREAVNPSAIRFIEQQQIAVLATADDHGAMWCSMVVGAEGLFQIPDAQTLAIQKSKIRSDLHDIWYANIQQQQQIGVLFFEPFTRKRYRINGHIRELETEFIVSVAEAYPNCPKYIQKRPLAVRTASKSGRGTITEGGQMTDHIRTWIQNADTFFMATQSASKKADASHRGGNLGFIKVLDNGDLMIPDYPGNSLFNSLGNIYESPRVGLLFVDFERGDTLQLTGEAALHFGKTSDEDMKQSGATGRFWSFRLQQWRIQTAAIPLVAGPIEYSAYNP